MSNSKFWSLLLGIFLTSPLALTAEIETVPPSDTPTPREMEITVTAKKRLIRSSESVSQHEVTDKDIKALPQGETIHLPRLLSTTMPGVVQGAFGQSFIRGNHANIQYMVDGVQLPDSPSNTFGEIFTPRNIDHMEVITGGIPAEYGERLAAVMKIYTKSGAEKPGGEVELDYGSFNTSSPYALYSGSNADGDKHYFVSAGTYRTDRGLDTPQPQSESNVNQGGIDVVHDMAWGHNEFAKVDWLLDNSNKFSAIVFNSFNFYQIPNYPSGFLPTDDFFKTNFTDQYGNGPYHWAPATTDDSQNESNTSFQLVWKKTLDDHTFLQLASYYKYSYIGVKNDPNNDLASAFGSQQISGAQASSFTESRPTNSGGIKADYTARLDEKNLVKTGVNLLFSQTTGGVTILSGTQGGSLTTTSDNSVTTGTSESVYVQDDYFLTKDLTLNAGIRFDSVQFSFGGNSPVYSADSMLQPRVGANYMLSEFTKVHAFYGKLFQPAPPTDLRATFGSVNGANTLVPYDIKSERDDYYEAGIAQQISEHVILLNAYYKNAVSMLDDSQLLNTSIAQPYNFKNGFAWGLELTVKGQLSTHWSEFMNYSYEIAMGNGVGGGLFSLSNPPSTDWQFLDHVQIHTANAGVTYRTPHFWWTGQSLFGSGLRTGPNNISSLNPHLTFDTTVGYEFTGENWYEKFKLSADVINIFNNVYPISIANGYNGSHYAAGTQYYIHLIKEI